jgi:hypothetical protein
MDTLNSRRDMNAYELSDVSIDRFLRRCVLLSYYAGMTKRIMEGYCLSGEEMDVDGRGLVEFDEDLASRVADDLEVEGLTPVEIGVIGSRARLGGVWWECRGV